MTNRNNTPCVTNEDLLKALQEAEVSTHFTIKDTPLYKLLHLVVDRLVETSTVFNEHEHPVHGVITEGNEYYSAGTGHTSTPALDVGYGCDRSQRIGEKYERE